MSSNKKITLILPSYNEIHSIGSTILEAVGYFESHRLLYEIIVSADGNDGTREFVKGLSAQNPNIQVIGHIQRRGKGSGIREAVEIAQGTFIGFADADNKTPITELDKVIPFLEQGIDMVIGSRAERQSIIERQQPWFRRIGSRGFAVLMHSVVGLWDIQDTQCGFKFFQGEIARNLFAYQKIDGYMYDVEILYLARLLHYQIYQVPVRWRDDGDSRLQLVRGNIRNIVDIFRLRFNARRQLGNAIQKQYSDEHR